MRRVALVTLTLTLAAIAAPGTRAQSAATPAAGAQTSARPTPAQTPAAASGAATPPANAAAAPIRPQPVGTMSELMIKILYPTSDAIFYVTTRTPETEEQWNELQAKALTLAESANLLLLPAHMRDEKQWPADAKLLRDAATAAFKAAKTKDVAAVDAVNDQLYQSCVQCHQHYRPNYGRGR